MVAQSKPTARRWAYVEVTLYTNAGAWVRTVGVDEGGCDGTYLGGPESHDRALKLGQRRSKFWADLGWRVPVIIREKEMVEDEVP